MLPQKYSDTAVLLFSTFNPFNLGYVDSGKRDNSIYWYVDLTVKRVNNQLVNMGSVH
jgi:hypothetical protein